MHYLVVKSCHVRRQQRCACPVSPTGAWSSARGYPSVVRRAREGWADCHRPRIAPGSRIELLALTLTARSSVRRGEPSPRNDCGNCHGGREHDSNMRPVALPSELPRPPCKLLRTTGYIPAHACWNDGVRASVDERGHRGFCLTCESTGGAVVHLCERTFHWDTGLGVACALLPPRHSGPQPIVATG